MSHTNKHRLFSLTFALSLFLLQGFFCLAQNNVTESPYTRFGYGSLAGYSSNRSRALGGVAIATRQANHINPGNPASYASVDSQTFIFDLGASVGLSYLKEGQNKDSKILGNLEYISTLFPLTKWMAVSVGLLPYSMVGYKFGSSKDLSSIKGLSYTETYSGKGNINDLYLGLGVTPFKGFSFGANIAYRYGSIQRIRMVEYHNPSIFNPQFFERLTLKGLALKLGLQQAIPLGRDKELLLGATYSPSFAFHSMAQTQELVLRNKKIVQVVRNDTIVSSNSYRIPHELGVGMSYTQKEKLFLEADVKYNIWNNALPVNPYFLLQNQLIASLGIAFIPNSHDRSLGKRIEYRFGLRGANSYLSIPSLSGKHNGYWDGTFSFGVGIPLVDKRSVLDLTIDYRYLMPREKGLVSENYLMLTLGLRFNEGWFKPLKLE